MFHWNTQGGQGIRKGPELCVFMKGKIEFSDIKG